MISMQEINYFGPPKYKIHGVKDGGKFTKELPATNDPFIMVEQTSYLTKQGFDIAIYELKEVVRYDTKD